MKKIIMTMFLMAGIVASGCWWNDLVMIVPPAYQCGIVLIDSDGNQQTTGGSELKIAIRSFYQTIAEGSAINYFFPSYTITGNVSQNDAHYKLYLYSIGDTGIPTLLETQRIEVDGFSLEWYDGNQPHDVVIGTPDEIFDEFPNVNKILITLQPFDGDGDYYSSCSFPHVNSWYNNYLFENMFLERGGSISTTKVREISFANCSLSVPGSVLPLTPTVTVSPATVTMRTYQTGSYIYKIDNRPIRSESDGSRTVAVHSNITVTIPAGELTGAPETTTYSAQITEARLIMTDADGGRETFTAHALQTGMSLPVFGRYGIDPWGINVNEELEFELILTADGVNSNQTSDVLTIVTPPAVDTATITVTGDNRPER